MTLHHKIQLTLGILLLVFITSCMPAFNIKKDANLNYNNKSIAVIAATRDKETITICNAISHELQKKTNFKVLTKGEIKQLYPEYPLKVKGPYKFAFTDIEDDYKLTDLKRVEEIKKKLNVDFIVFFWCPSRFVNNSGRYLLIMQGFTRDKKGYFAYGKYRLKHSGKGELILGAAGDYNEMVKNFAKGFAQVIGKKTETLKK